MPGDVGKELSIFMKVDARRTKISAPFSASGRSKHKAALSTGRLLGTIIGLSAY